MGQLTAVWIHREYDDKHADLGAPCYSDKPGWTMERGHEIHLNNGLIEHESWRKWGEHLLLIITTFWYACFIFRYSLSRMLKNPSMGEHNGKQLTARSTLMSVVRVNGSLRRASWSAAAQAEANDKLNYLKLLILSNFAIAWLNCWALIQDNRLP